MIAKVTIPGNIHDSVSFFPVYKILSEKYKDKIKNICLDAAYTTPAICREIILNGHTPLMPYKRPMTQKGFFKNTNMYMTNIMIVTFVQIMKY